jgi:hypothetical protein
MNSGCQGVKLGLQGSNLGFQRKSIRNTAVKALTTKNAEFNFGVG